MVECLENECESMSDGDFLFKDDYFEDCEIDNLVLHCNYEEVYTNFEKHILDPVNDNHCQGCICQSIIFPTSCDQEMVPEKTGNSD